MLAGGVESMSMVPMMGNKVAMNPAIFEDEHVAIAYGMGITAEKVAGRWKVSRAEQDAFALESHRRAVAAIEAGHFDSEVLPYTVRQHLPGEDGAIRIAEQPVHHDEGPRSDTSLEALAKLKPVFAEKGSVTAGNSSQTSDGAGAVVLMSERRMKELKLEPLARFVGFSVAGVPPEIMGIGPVAAVPKALQKAGWSQDEVETFELNEAFAAQAISVNKELGWDMDKVNVNGGVIALGHPLGMSGARLALTAAVEMGERDANRALCTMCIGVGQ